jgi:hypothetical protein
MFTQEIAWSAKSRKNLVLAMVLFTLPAVLPALVLAPPNVGLIAVGSAVLGLGLASLIVFAGFGRLRIELREDSLRLAFPMMWRTLKLEDIARVQTTTYSWLRWGIGYRVGFGKTMMNVGGDGGRAVELTLRSGRRFLFSSPEPEVAVREIARALGRGVEG